MNPLFSDYGNQQNQNPSPLLQQFLNFKKGFSGDPKQTVQYLLNSGKMSQEQFNTLANQATNLQKMLNIK